MTFSSSSFKWKHLIVLIIFIAFVTICSGSGHVIKKRQATGKNQPAPSPQAPAPQAPAPAPQAPAPQAPTQAPQAPPAQQSQPAQQPQPQPAQPTQASPQGPTQASPQGPTQPAQQPAQPSQASPQGPTQPAQQPPQQPTQAQPAPQGQGQTQPAQQPQPAQTQTQGGTHQSANGNDQKSTSLSFVANDFTINSCTDTLKCPKENVGTTDKHIPSTTAPKVTSEFTTTYNVCTDNTNCKVVPITPGQTVKMVTTTQPADPTIVTIPPANGATPKPNAKFTTFKFLSTEYQVYPGFSTVTTMTGTDGQVATYETYVPPSTVVVVKEVTGVQAADSLSTDGIVGGGNSFNEMRRSGSGLLGIIMSLWVVTITLVYMIKNVD
ncbi:4190_t:CDS:2 [Cetraspora pellucida]|uniref:4190_t:CDS:1 n=1 Tax=Cetraspora pellucida TaxID=1433469 RepID=A0A9N9F4J7_9GLOM|nr:4190_t:CDS:2 [Cetraspora pellucida]